RGGERVRGGGPGGRGIRRLGGAAGAVAISVDTTSAAVARSALDEGADAINDVSAGLDDPAMLGLAAGRGAGLVLMHRLTTPERDRYSDEYERAPGYADVVAEVRGVLAQRAGAAETGGGARGAIA